MSEKEEIKKGSGVTNPEDIGKNDMKKDAIMRMSRRRFVQMASATAAALALGRIIDFDITQPAAAFYNSSGLQKFAQPLRGVYPIDPNGIPVAIPDGKRSWDDKVAQHYTIDINQYQDTLYSPDPTFKTALRGYHSRANLGGTPPQRHLGGIIVAERGIPVQITFQNNLTGDHPLPVDDTIMGANLGHNRVATHLHGGEVPWISDGGPFSWFNNTTSGNYGTSVGTGSSNIYKAINKELQPGQAEVYYPNRQSARLMWYHDHAVGITRLNAYSGIASAYIIRDSFEKGLRRRGLPDFIENGGREIPLVFQDKIFVGTDIVSKDPTWTGLLTPGSLWYPHDYEAARWSSAPGSTQPTISAIPEMFGDTMLVNGVVHPFAPVEPRRYRLRILNACQARFLNLQLYEEIAPGSGQPDFSKPGPDFLVIGAEGGFLAKPVLVKHSQMIFVDPPFNTTVDPANPGGSLITAPAERWDIIVDFSAFAGKKLLLYNDAPAPFPGGDALNDYQDISSTGLNTRTIMRFEVATAITGTADKKLSINSTTPLALNPDSLIDKFLVPLNTPVIDPITGNVNIPSIATVVRELTLNEVFDEYGRLIQMLGTNTTVPLPSGFSMDPSTPDAPNNYARAYTDTITENVINGAVEVWQIANLTGDTHPMHFHLVNVQLLARQSFVDPADPLGQYHYHDGVPTYFGNARGPDPTELGWKETVKMNPGEVTTVIMKFNLPKVPFDVPASPRTGGNEYVWHCHILEHEEHDMMRPLVVIGKNDKKEDDKKEDKK
ncbi:Laccase [uncultured archaeon]|nr:Laccase [uncultured archaeon]